MIQTLAELVVAICILAALIPAVSSLIFGGTDESIDLREPNPRSRMLKLKQQNQSSNSTKG